MKNCKELKGMTKDMLVDYIQEIQSTLIVLGKNCNDYKEALQNARTLLAENKKQIKNTSEVYNEVKLLKEKLASLTQTKMEPIVAYLKNKPLSSYVLTNYFRDLFIEYQYKYSKTRISLTKLETQLLQTVLWRYQQNRSEISVYNTDFTPDNTGKYAVAFNVDTSLLTNQQIRYYNQILDCNIPENQMTPEEKELLQGQDREVMVIER